MPATERYRRQRGLVDAMRPGQVQVDFLDADKAEDTAPHAILPDHAGQDYEVE